MNEIKITWNKDKPSDSLREYQSGLEMCFASETDKSGKTMQVTDFVICKDYLHDVVSAFLLNKKVDHQYFSYDPTVDNHLYLDRTRLIIGDTTDANLESKIPALIDFINQFEKRIHLMCSQAFKCNPPKRFEKTGCFMIEGSSRWMLSAPMLSLYSLLIRIGTKHVLGENFDETVDKIVMNKMPPLPRGVVGCNDHEYLKEALPGMERILRLGYARIFHRNIKDNYPDIDVNFMHHKAGIVGYSKKLCELHFPHWFRFDKSKKKKLTK